MKNNLLCLYILLISSFIYSQSNNSFIDDFNDDIILYIDPFNINTFSLNKFFPNQNQDISYYSIKFDGSTFFPLNQSLPSKFYFNLDDEGNYSQLIYNQRKADNYFDSNISLKNDVGDDIDMLLQLETKSIVDNINQNLFLDYNKKSEKFNIDFGYMYHYENDPENYEIINNDSEFLKEFESYNSGFSMEYFLNNLTIVSNISSQISSYSRPELFTGDYSYIDYESQIFWNDNKIDCSLSQKSSFYLKNQFKKKLFENNEEYLKDFKQNIISAGYSYNLNNRILFNLSADKINKDILPSFLIQYKSAIIQMDLSLDNQLISYFVDTDALFGNYYYYEIKKYNFHTYGDAMLIL